jgi:hypothetical protein
MGTWELFCAVCPDIHPGVAAMISKTQNDFTT